NGILVSPGNSQELNEAIIKLIKDKALRKTMVGNCFNSVKNFNIKETVNKNIKLYLKLKENE
ncbi:MAG: glycosyltransferase family 1 protein, partial [Calditrichia bacterium]|nr:glycosyltransferase family 1 protein [Calditrichia bacterium]